MRILLSMPILEMVGGGAENFAFWLSRVLSDRGHEMHVVTDRGGPVPRTLTVG